MISSIMLRNTVTFEELLLHQTETSDFILAEGGVDWGAIESDHHTFKFVDQIGVHVTTTSLETRKVNITGWVIGETIEILGFRKMYLNGFVNPRQPMELHYDDYILNFLPDTTIKYAITVADNNEFMCKFNIVGLCADPLFKDNAFTSVMAADYIPMFHFPLIITDNPNPPGGIVFGYRQPSLFVEVINKGDVPIGFEIEFSTRGAVSNPSVINVLTQEFFKVKKNLIGGERVVAHTVIGSKKIVGRVGNAEFENYFKYRDFGSTWLQLQPGQNIFTYQADSGVDALDVYFRFNNRYLEVQR